MHRVQPRYCALYCVFITVAISKLRNSKLVVPLQCCCCCCTSCIVVAGVSGGPLCPVHYLNVWPRETACNLHLRDTTHSSSPLTRSSADPTHSHNITQNLEAEEGKRVFRLFSVIYLSNLYTCTQIKSISLYKKFKNS